MNRLRNFLPLRVKTALLHASLLVFLVFPGEISITPACAQPPPADKSAASSSANQAQLAERIEVRNVSSDEDIDRRLTGILEATGWFSEISVKVEEGVVFLDGRTSLAEHRNWAGALANKTSDVVAVVNRLEVKERSVWNFSPALNEVKYIWDAAQQNLPRFGLGLAILLLTGILAKLVSSTVRKILARRLKPLLRDVAARILGIFIFLIGCYFVLQVAGLSGLAATVLGGTGLIGLVAGIAFRDILENYLASILISLRNPFRIGDLVEISGHTGMVLKVTTRGTVLMNLDGNHVQIPNATVYKSIIRNYTANPNRRFSFDLGIGFDSDPALAQRVALDILARHPAVLTDPEPQVLVDKVGAATLNLAIYYWFNGTIYDGLKVKSSLIRLVVHAYMTHGISMPDEAREVIFPKGVAVHMVEGPPPGEPITDKAAANPDETGTEGDLATEDGHIREQARKARVPEEGASLIGE